MELVHALVLAGFSVQLHLLEDKQRDQVVIKTNAGRELAYHPDLQNNKNYYQREELCKGLATTAIGEWRTKMDQAQVDDQRTG